MVAILKKLQFTVERDGDSLTVTAPAFRQDIEQEADICEEVLRYAGYDRIPTTRLRGETTTGGLNDKAARQADLRRQLTGMGFYETMTFSFVSPKVISLLGWPEDDGRSQPLMLRNPLGEDTACMRTTLLCGLFKTLETNLKNGNENGRVYEMGTVYDALHRTAENLPTENPELAIGMYGAGADFYAVRGVVEALCRQAGVQYQLAECDEPFLHPGRRVCLTAGGETLAAVGEAHPDILEKFDLTGRVYVAVVYLPVLFRLSRPMGEVKPIARFPAVSRDLALVMAEDKPVGPLMDAIRGGCGAMLEDIRMFDVFRGVQIGLGNKSVAFSLTFRAADHTLTEEEITRLTDKAIKIAKQHSDAALRS